MAKFDIITAAGSAYQTSWAARQYLLRLAAVPLAIKLICYTIAGIFAGSSEEQSGSYLLFMLIMVPSLLAEGWMLAHFVRFIVLGQTWPFRPTGDIDADRTMLSTRARGILSGLIVFTLIQMAIGLLSDTVLRVMGPYMSADGTMDPHTIPTYIPVLSILLLAGMFWGFRLLWSYVPFSLNMDMKTYLSAMRGAAAAFNLIGLWLLCCVPFIMFVRIVGPLFAALPGDAGIVSVTMMSIVVDTVRNIVTTAGVTFALREVFSKQNRLDRRV